MKIALSMVLLFGFLTSAPATAKQAHAPRAAVSSAGATKAGSAKPVEPIDADVTVLTPRGGFTSLNRNANASQKLVKQENFTHRPDVIGPIRPAVRNAIGQPIQPRSVMVETPRMSPSVQAPGLVPKPITRSVAAPQVSPSPIRRGTFHPVTTAGVSSAGSTGGTRLIRPWAGPVGIGGPAHPVGGINGTTVRTTR